MRWGFFAACGGGLGGGELWFGLVRHGADGFVVRSAKDAALGDDGGDVLGRGDVEGGVFDGYAVGGHLLAVGVGDLACVALFDRDAFAGGGLQVEGGPGGGNVEGDAVLFGEDGDAVGADLVGDVAVGGDAVSSDDDGLDAAPTHERRGHVVAEDSGGDVVLHELPCGEAGALKEWAGLVGEDVDLVAALDGGADDAEGSAVAAGGEGAGVAVSEDGAFEWEERCAVSAHLFAGGDVLVVHAAGLGDDCGFDLGDGGVLCGELVVEGADLVDAPEEIDGGGPGFGEGLGDDSDFGGEGWEGGRGAAVDADGDAHGGRDADGGGSADDHVADDGGDLFVVGGENVGLLEGELGLIEEVNAGREPFEGGNHVSYSLDDLGRYGDRCGGGCVGCRRLEWPGSVGSNRGSEPSVDG
jgi:hypothetical protein